MRTMKIFYKFCIILSLLSYFTFVHCRELKSNVKTDRQEIMRWKRMNWEKEKFLTRLLESSFGLRRSGNNGIHSRRNYSIEPFMEEENRHGMDFGSQRVPRRKNPGKKRPKGKKRLSVVDFVENDWCCPQRFEVIAPEFGKNRTGHVVELYKDDKIHQRFYERVCDPKVADRPCRFLESQSQKISRCTQQHAYTYALVKSSGSVTGWSLDHIYIRSGCACKIYHPKGRP